MHTAAASTAPTLLQVSEAAAPVAVAFLAPGIADRDRLAAALPETVRAVDLPAAGDTLLFMAEWLAANPGAARVHLFAHGAPGRLLLADGDLTAERVAAGRPALTRLGRLLGADGALLVYGCRTGAGPDGRALVAALAEATGVAVAAASAPVGSPRRGGTWQLDVGSAPGALDLGAEYDGLFVSMPPLFFTASNGTGTELWVTRGSSGSTSMIREIDDHFEEGGEPQQLFQLDNSRILFSAQGDEGRELWISDGTEAGTSLLKDIYSGSESSEPSGFVELGSKVLFSANDGNHRGLWVTDGTASGTSLLTSMYSDGTLFSLGDRVLFSGDDGNGFALWVSDGTAEPELLNGSAGSPRNFTQVGARVFFTAQGEDGEELWVTDGTENGTSLVEDIRPGSSSSYASGLVAFQGKLLFSASDDDGNGLWTSDGTEEGTTRLVGFNGSPSNLTVSGDKAYFTADDGDNGEELWVTDGTSDGTSMVGDIRSGSNGAYIRNLVAGAGGSIAFSADDGSGQGLWVSNGTAAGTSMVAEVENFDEPIIAGSRLFFSADDAAHGTELWATTGSGFAVSMVTDINTRTRSALEEGSLDAANLGSLTIFEASNGFDAQLWVTDGASSPSLLAELGHYDDYGAQFRRATEIGGKLLFTVDGEEGEQLWVSDGTAGGTSAVREFEQVYGLTKLDNSRLVFIANDGTSGEELWVTDGTYAGTSMLKDINTGSDGSDIGYITPLGSLLLFQAETGGEYEELWVTDGTAAGTIQLTDERDWNGEPNVFLTLGSKALFGMGGGGEEQDLWVTDGTVSGTSLLHSDAESGEYDGFYGIALNNNLAVFVAEDTENNSGTELWVTDGGAGTSLLKDINPSDGGYEAYIGNLTLLGSTVLFSANDGDHGRELWITDGTYAGTSMLKDINPGNEDGDPGFDDADISDIVVLNGLALFDGDNGSTGDELWVSDGTYSGTSLLRDINPGEDSGDIEFLGVVGGRLYFSADDGANDGEDNDELWVTDGTYAGTSMVADINPHEGAGIEDAIVQGSRLLFSADDFTHGYELWSSDGTEGGTSMLADINTRTRDADPEQFLLVDAAAPQLVYSNVQDGKVNLNEDIVLTFSENVRDGDGRIWLYTASDDQQIAEIELTGDADERVRIFGNTIIISTEDLQSGVEYYLQTSGDLEDRFGNSFVNIEDESLTFTAQSDEITLVTSPDDEVDVAETADIVLTFSEDVQAGEGTIYLRRADTNAIAGSISVSDTSQVTFSGSTVTIDPTANLASNTHYYLQMAAGVIESVGGGTEFAGISGSTTVDFTTDDTIGPTVSRFNPTDGTNPVEIDRNLVLTFSETVQAGHGRIILHNADTNAIAGSYSVTDTTQVTFNGSTVTINPTLSLDFATHYYLEIGSGVIEDSAGNNFAGISGSTTYDFTTSAAPVSPPASPPASPPVSPPVTQTVDGVTVQQQTTTNTDGSTTKTTTIPVVTSTRQEQTGNNSVADIPLVTQGSTTVLTAQVPTGVGLTVSGSSTTKTAGTSVADLIREIEAHTDEGSSDRTSLTGGGTGFLGDLDSDTPLIVQTIVPTVASGTTTAPTAPLVISAPAVTDGQAQTALVIDTRGLPSGTVIQLQNVSFAAVVGAVQVTGGEGSQNVFGDGFAQFIVLGEDDDTLHGGDGADTVGSKTGDDFIYGDAGADNVFGGDDNDFVFGGSGVDTVQGNKGADFVQGNQGNDVVWAGQDNDTARGGQDDDQVYGDLGDDLAYGDYGADQVYGNAGNDTIWGGDGNDIALDTADTIFGGQGNDVVYAQYGADSINGDLGNDWLQGNRQNDTLSGGDGADTLRGGHDADLLDGGADNDELWGDFENDTMTGGAGADVFVLRSGDGADVITDFSFAAGDRLRLETGATWTVSDANGSALIALSGGGSVTLQGVTASQVSASWMVSTL